jgi:hypothetical protein
MKPSMHIGSPPHLVPGGDGSLAQASASSSQVSVVQSRPSSQSMSVPSQRPAPSQASASVQKKPSSHVMPAGASPR